MKLKTISRSETDYTRDRRDDVVKMQRNANPELHPFERAREYTRALTAAKMDKIFAKPLVGALDGHSDGVNCMATSKKSLVAFVSGACDGELRVWDLSYRRTIWSAFAHSGFVTGLSVASDGNTFFSCGDDKIIKQWRMVLDEDHFVQSEEEDEEEQLKTSYSSAARSGKGSKDNVEPFFTYNGNQAYNGMDCHWVDPLFVTCGDTVDVWDHSRSEPIQTFNWGVDSINCVKYNPAEAALLASTASDRNICLYDIRAATPVRKVVLRMSSNKLAWNPHEPFNFTVANEDHNLYTFDMRKMERALMVHKDHVSAVMDVSYSPTGKEFVSASYDRSVRIFRVREGRSREVYHARRMQRVFCANFTADSNFVLSGSDDFNVRIWKANASKSLGKLLPRQERKQAYNEKLLQRYGELKEVRRIVRHRHIPKPILKANRKKEIMHRAEQVKRDRERKHAGEGKLKKEPERKAKVVRVLE